MTVRIMLVVTLTNIWTISVLGKQESIEPRTSLHAGIILFYSQGNHSTDTHTSILFTFSSLFSLLITPFHSPSNVFVRTKQLLTLLASSSAHRLDLYKESGGKKNKKVLGLAWVSTFPNRKVFVLRSSTFSLFFLSFPIV